MAEKVDPFWEAVESFGVSSVFVLPEWIADRAGETPAEPPGDVLTQMAGLRDHIQGCMKCPLGRTRNNIVFGEGNPHSGILVIGEGPGATEDETGRPFVGRSGKLLDKIFESIGLNRECLFIANIVKCRPPNNRAPLPLEAEVCGKYLHRQMEIMKPGIIVALGASAARHILDTKRGIGVLREEFHSYRNVPVLVTYHPAALLRSPLLKRPVWEDMKKLKAFLDRLVFPEKKAADMSEPKKQPWSAEAERGVLAGVLLDPEMAVEVFANLTANDFFDPRHRILFTTAQNIDSRGEPIDFVTVTMELERLGQTEQAGGMEYPASIAEDLPFLSNVLSYAGIVKDCSLLRQFLNVASRGMDRVYSTSVKAADLLDEVSQKIFDIGTNAAQRDFVKVSELGASVMSVIETMRNSRDGVTGVSTGIAPLDRLTTGFHGGEMNVIAARPGVGKTSLALNMARHIAEQSVGTVAFFSLEMSALQLTQRLVCSMAGVGTQPIIDNTISDMHLKDIYAASERLARISISINDTPSISSAEIRAKTRRLAQREKEGVAAVFVDYLQLMSGAEDIENHQLKVAKNSADLKALAKDLDVPVIVLSQLSRGAAKREGPPRLSDLRDSGAIEQDADIVMFLHDENADSGDDDRKTHGGLRRILLKIAKQRKGQRGEVNLIFNAATTTFTPEETREEW